MAEHAYAAQYFSMMLQISGMGRRYRVNGAGHRTATGCHSGPDFRRHQGVGKWRALWSCAPPITKRSLRAAANIQPGCCFFFFGRTGPAQYHYKSRGIKQALALQLRFLFELCTLDVGEARFGLMGSAPERPGDNAGGLNATLCEFYRDAADFLDRPADEDGLVVRRRGSVFLSGTALA